MCRLSGLPLAQRLPEYMVPAAFVTLAALPLTPNGKLDRQALPPPESEATNSTRVAPRTPTEEKLTAIVSELLGIQEVGIHDNFFAIGGDSILAIQLVCRAQQVGLIVPVMELFKHQTVAELAQALGDLPVENPSPALAISTPRANSCLVPLQPDGERPPWFCVHGAGGYAANFAVLARALGRDQPFYGLQSRGLSGDQEPIACLEEMVAAYLQAIRSVQPEGPYHLAGYSMGGCVAVEMARKLDRQGEEVAPPCHPGSPSSYAPTRSPGNGSGIRFLVRHRQGIFPVPVRLRRPDRSESSRRRLRPALEPPARIAK